ncbi:MAG: hypothetical protein OEY89_12230 [Gammaproteobacteria bacterium]|nr:hypothetical protein [Gammaproteobacteria bacterium]
MNKPTGESKIAAIVRAAELSKSNGGLISELSETIRFQGIQAKLIRAKYLALVESVFTSAINFK